MLRSTAESNVSNAVDQSSSVPSNRPIRCVLVAVAIDCALCLRWSGRLRHTPPTAPASRQPPNSALVAFPAAVFGVPSLVARVHPVGVGLGGLLCLVRPQPLVRGAPGALLGALVL